MWRILLKVYMCILVWIPRIYLLWSSSVLFLLLVGFKDYHMWWFHVKYYLLWILAIRVKLWIIKLLFFNKLLNRIEMETQLLLKNICKYFLLGRKINKYRVLLWKHLSLFHFNFSSLWKKHLFSKITSLS